MNKLAILLAGILVLSGLSFAAPQITDRSLYVQYNTYNCKAEYVQGLLFDAAGYATAGGDTDLSNSLLAVMDDLETERTALQTYGVAVDRAAFASELTILRADLTDGMYAYRAARRTAISEGWTDKATARSNEYVNRLVYWSCTTGIMLA